MTVNPETRFRAYVGAKFSAEPVEADFYKPYPSFEAAQLGVADAKRGGFGFVHDTLTGELFGDMGCGKWQLRSAPPVNQSATLDNTAVEAETLRMAIKALLPIGDDRKPDSAVIPIYVRMGELRALHALTAKTVKAK